MHIEQTTNIEYAYLVFVNTQIAMQNKKFQTEQSSIE